MPKHQANSARDVALRVRRARTMARDLRRLGASPSGLTDECGPLPDGLAGERPRTTVEATIRPVGGDRYRRLGWAPGEPHVVRTDLGGTPSPGRAVTRRSLLYVAHHTDTHVCDAQSPARLEAGETFGWVNPGSDGGHRPQETCTAQVLDQMVVATNAVAESPFTGARMAWCIQTGDNTDNRTAGEVRWWMDVLDGRPVTANSGAPGRYEGVQRSGWKGAWHPDDPSRDRFGRAGFPRLPGFLDAAVAPFQPTGLDVPWLAVFGNHDSTFMGTFGPLPGIRIDRLGPMLAGAAHKPAGVLGLVRAVAHATLLGADTARWDRWARRLPLGLREATADPDARRALSLEEYLDALFDEDRAGVGPGPVGHGFDPASRRERTSWWTRSEGDHVQVMGLDTCNHTVGDGGRIGPRQAAWLEEELARHHTRWQDPSGTWVTGEGPDRLVVLASHHNSWTTDSPFDDANDPGPGLHGPGLVQLLRRFPNVVLWLNGHCHEHLILHHPRPAPDGGGGIWEVTTASCIDFGQQGRTVELVDNGDGTLSILVTVLDHAAPPVVPHRRDATWTPVELASMSRELAVNDCRWIDPVELLGGPEDRNVELVLPWPHPPA